MALILEQLDARRAQVVRRLTLDAEGLVIGRALTSALVVDDAHVDAAHVRVTRAEDGALHLEDLGSVNGIDAGPQGRVSRLALSAGTQFRLGRTPFRVADSDAPLPPAVPLGAVSPQGTQWFERGRNQILLPLLLLGVAGWQTYFSTATREAGTAALGMVVVLAILMAIWAGIWALVGRGLVRRASFLAQNAVSAGTGLVVIFTTVLVIWATFLVPSAHAAWSTLDVLASIATFVVATYWQLGLATSLSPRRRWIGAAGAIGLLVAVIGAFALVADDAFTDVPEFQGLLRYAPAAVIPATDVDGFRAAIAALRTEVDSLKSRAVAAPER